MEKKELYEIVGEDTVQVLKYIGEYLASNLRREGIITCNDLMQKLESFVHYDLDNNEIRELVKFWLEDVMMNLRSKRCCPETSRFRNGNEYMYRARYENEYGFNAIVDFWRFFAQPPYKYWIPKRKTGRTSILTKYPNVCKT